MLIGGLGTPEIIILLIVFLMIVGPVVGLIFLVRFLIKRSKNSTAGTKKCAFCAYSIPVEATVCQFCGKELDQ